MRYAVTSCVGHTGTSMLMHCLHLGGLPVLQNRANIDPGRHPDGFYEWTGKWQQMPEKWEDGQLVKMAGPKVFTLTYPDDWEIMAVYIKRDATEIFHRESSHEAIKQWTNSNNNFLRGMIHTPAIVDYIEVWYDDILEDPKREFKRLRDAWFPIDVEKACQGVKPEYHHQRNHQ